MTGAELRPRSSAVGLKRYPARVQARIREAWADAEVASSDILERFSMPTSTFDHIRRELGPRPKLTFRPSTTLRAALLTRNAVLRRRS